VTLSILLVPALVHLFLAIGRRLDRDAPCGPVADDSLSNATDLG